MLMDRKVDVPERWVADGFLWEFQGRRGLLPTGEWRIRRSFPKVELPELEFGLVDIRGCGEIISLGNT